MGFETGADLTILNKFTNKYVEKAELTEYIKVITSNSIEPTLPKYCEDYIDGKPQIIIIDSSHQYKHTLQELKLWYDYLSTNGFISHTYNSVSCSVGSGTDRGYFILKLRLWNKGVYNQGINNNYCNNYF